MVPSFKKRHLLEKNGISPINSNVFVTHPTKGQTGFWTQLKMKKGSSVLLHEWGSWMHEDDRNYFC
jgi:hypothetical protein